MCLQNPEVLVTEYVLPLSFGLVIMPEEMPFSHTVELHASLQDVGEFLHSIDLKLCNYPTSTFFFSPSVLPSITGICDETNFYLSVKYGSQGSNFQTWVGGQHLTDEVMEVYNFQENGTHFSLIVPYNAKDTAFEVYLKVGLELSAQSNFMISYR